MEGKMLKSLFSKLLVIYISIILVGFILIAFGMSETVENYFIEKKEETLIKQAKKIEREYKKAYKTGVIDTDRINFEMEALNRYLNAKIWLINRDGEIYVNSRIEDISILDENLKYKEINKVFNGEILKRQGYFKRFYDEPVLTIGYPIKLNNEVVFALFMHSSIPEINQTVSDILMIIIMALLISTLIAVILVFFMSKNITNQIKDLNEGVKLISQGNFEKRLKINRKDELGELAKGFNDMAKDLNKLEELRRKFISNLSHDLRSPLTSINGYVNAILDGTIDDDKQDKYLKIVRDESKRLTNLTNDILDLSKMQSGELDLKKERFNINEVIINELDKFEDRIYDKDINIVVNFMKEKKEALGDINHIKRVIYNLLDNAIKFVDCKGDIEIKTEYKNKKINVSIRNTFGEIPKKELKHIFNRFNKLDVSRGKDKHGSGLGLAIVKEIIKAHDEDIKVTSNKNLGVIFTFTLET
ncbi:MAG: cell wall metabolism sensor histidine kinase WalK [Firmicutes bacterium]|nr:cell wall metabolism sensor histidine kinase WalK [Bacillota bacterium]